MRPARVTPPQSPRPAPPLAKKRKELRARQTKTSDTGLEDFVHWTNVVANEPTEEEEMFSLAAQMRKRAASSEGETTSISGGKRPRRPSSDEEA